MLAEGSLAARRALKKYYGYDAFRPGQEEIINGILAGRPILAVLPTGAGKSVCFQVPGLLLPHLTLVISPLLSLMKDQAEHLAARGIGAAFLGSHLSRSQQGQVLARARAGETKFLYLVPERLAQKDFRSFAAQVPISLVAVDEAHCVSQWGPSFRPSYYQIPLFLEGLARRPRLCAFTASATPRVRQDIIQRLAMEGAQVLVGGFDRPNLFLGVKKTANKPRALLDFLRRHRGEGGIVYCATRLLVEEVSRLLQRQGFPALRYHGGLTPQERRYNQDCFVREPAPLMVATNAFGMGIDKGEVRFVLHYNMPKDLEAYYQEAGRAGRDGQAAECLLLFNEEDVRINQYLIAHGGSSPALQALEGELLAQMQGYCAAKGCLRHYLLAYFGQDSPASCASCSNCRRPSLWARLFS